MRYATAILLAALSVEFSACQPDSSESGAPVWTRAEIIVSIGDDESAGEDYLFGSISSVAADAQGRIYVADMLASGIRVFDQTGTLLQRVGRRGEGPGEFQAPFGILISGEELWVADGMRIKQMRPARAGAVPDSPGQVGRSGGPPMFRRARRIADHYYAPSYFYPLEGGFHYFYLVIGAEGVVDTIRVPPLPNMDRVRGTAYRGRDADVQQRRIINSLARAPFEPVAVWDITTRGTVIAGSGETPLQEFDAAGRVLRTFELPVAPRAISTAERNDSAAALSARLEALTIPLDQIEGVSPLIRDGSVPATVPAYTGVHVAADGRIWVRVWPPANDTARSDFVVLSAAGEFEALVTVPVDLSGDIAPHFDGGLIVGVTKNPETDVQSVVVASVQFPG